MAQFLDASLFSDLARPVAGEALQLRGSYCPACARWEFPVRVYCPVCAGPVSVGALSTSGTVRRATSVMHSPPGSQIAAPYVVALVDFPEGLSILGVVPDADIDQVQPGVRVLTIAIAVGDRIGYGYQPT